MCTGLHGRCTEVRADHTAVPSPTNNVTLTAVILDQDPLCLLAASRTAPLKYARGFGA